MNAEKLLADATANLFAQPGRPAFASRLFAASVNIGKLTDGAINLLERLSSVRSDPMLSEQGKRDQIDRLLQPLKDQWQAQRKDLAEAAKELAKEIDTLPRPRALRPEDAASAIGEMELRAWLRSLPASERATTLLKMPREATDAALRQPALSGLTDSDVMRVRHAALAAETPTEVATAAALSGALGSTRHQLLSVRDMLRANGADVDSWMTLPMDLCEPLRERLAPLGVRPSIDDSPEDID